MFKFCVLSVLLFSMCLSNPVSVFGAAQVLSDKETLLVVEYQRPEPVCEAPKLLLNAKNDAIKKDKIDNIIHNDWFCMSSREEIEKACTYTILDDYLAKKDNIEYTAKDTEFEHIFLILLFKYSTILFYCQDFNFF